MKEFLAAHPLEVIGVAIAVIIPLVAAWVKRRHRKKTKQDRKLRTHFEELRKEAELVISSASNLARMARDFSIVVAVGSQAVTTSDTKETKVSASFEAHFPEQAKGFGILKQEIGEHNTNCKNFGQKIKIAFESQGISIVQNDQGDHSICVFEAALDALFTSWRELTRGNRPWPDFQKVVPQSVNGGYALHASGWGSSAVAFAKTDDDLKKCELALAEIADNVENQRQVSEVVNNGDKLILGGKEFANQLASELSDIGEFWRGRKGKEFRELKRTCPRCRELF